VNLLARLFPSATDAEARFQERFAPLRNTVLDADAVFSGSAMSDNLRALHPLALQVGPTSRAMGDLLWLEFVVLNKRQMASEALPLGLRALEILDRHDPSVQDSFDRHYALGQSATAADEHATAILHLRRAASDADEPDGPPLNPSQRLGLQEDIAFSLHEEGRFEEALALNMTLLADARAAFGPGPDARLAGVLSNIAQNAYELGDMLTARNHLEQRLELGLSLLLEDITDDTLFQLCVLSHEAGDNTQAQEHVEHLMALAQASQDDDRIERARHVVAEFEQRMDESTIDPRRPLS
jgi:tetratricopeptide (TPR) repeat protein